MYPGRGQRSGLPLIFCALLLLCLAPAALAVPPEEDARIEALLLAVSRETDIVFIRNGKEYSAKQAAAHLRLKLDHARSRISTAEQFIDTVGSFSSISGSPYLIRKPGEKPRPAKDFLYELLWRTERREL
jgi:hypothetical protein